MSLIQGFSKDAAGRIVTGAGYVYHKDGDTFRGVQMALNGSGYNQSFVCTGVYYISAASGDAMLQTTTGNYLDMESGEWTPGGYGADYSKAQAQSYLNKLIANQKHILQNNLLCARYSYKLTADQKQTLYGLQKRLQDRESEMLESGCFNQAQTSEAYGYQYLDNYLTSFMATGVGLVVTATTAIIISAVVIASLSTAAYFCYKWLYEKSVQDVKYSDDLTRILTSKLTEEEYQQLLEETRGIVTKRSILDRIGASSSTLKWVALAAGAVAIFSIFKSKKGE